MGAAISGAVDSASPALVEHHPDRMNIPASIGPMVLVQTTSEVIQMPSQPAGKSDEFEALFVQSAQGVTSGDGALTLHGLAPSTLMFSDRPERIVGHLTSGQFIEGWGHGENSFLDDPPNAVLSFLDTEDEGPEDVVVTLTNPLLDGQDLTYTIDVLDGELPASTGPCSLFIDPIGRPLSPVSVMGVRRRGRRRARRL
jgi:hypothetical protein